MRRGTEDALGTRNLSITESFKKAEAVSFEQKKVKDNNVRVDRLVAKVVLDSSNATKG